MMGPIGSMVVLNPSRGSYGCDGSPRVAMTGRRSDQVDSDIDVATHSFGIRTGPIRFVDKGLGDLALGAWQAHVEANSEKVAVVSCVEVDFCVDCDVFRRSDLYLASTSSRKASRSFRQSLLETVR
jgi:hypothetical protein